MAKFKIFSWVQLFRQTIKSITEKLAKKNNLKAYWELTKPRVMFLVIFTGSTYATFSPNILTPTGLERYIFCILALSLGAASCGALNMALEGQSDLLMTRTKNRPVPSNRISKSNAIIFGIILGLLGLIISIFLVNFMATLFLAISILIYVALYTIYLKKSSSHNVVIGGISGALPPVIVSYALDNSLTYEAFLMFLIIFLWTPAHSYALSMHLKDDYAKAGIITMQSAIGEINTKRLIIFYTLLTVICVFFTGLYVGKIFLFLSSILGGWFLIYSLFLLQNKITSIKYFKYSILYLFFIYLFLLIKQ